MIDFLLWIVIGVCWILGFNLCFQEGEIFGKIGEKLKPLPDWIKKPTFDCPYCMSSVHGTILFFLFIPYAWYYWILYCFCLTGFVVIVKK